jgi:hypothetical protein
MTTAQTPAPEGITAIRTKKGSKFIVKVAVPGTGAVHELGGARAARAVAAVVSRWPSHAETGFMVELRADYTAAANLAANYTNPNRKVRGMSVEGYTAVWATCVRVVDA